MGKHRKQRRIELRSPARTVACAGMIGFGALQLSGIAAAAPVPVPEVPVVSLPLVPGLPIGLPIPGLPVQQARTAGQPVPMPSLGQLARTALLNGRDLTDPAPVPGPGPGLPDLSSTASAVQSLLSGAVQPATPAPDPAPVTTPSPLPSPDGQLSSVPLLGAAAVPLLPDPSALPDTGIG